ncbi:hypothetical protein Taro_048358 [Colocasia esculenta]|uniref:Amino acid transporter transmembrane domain-containing protein n=1 Tax=Colocasia esculenta TaxID=4460 RepID=A0A843WY63_COLES|nr:hypothetical protein [Colocasia esculenta]
MVRYGCIVLCQGEVYPSDRSVPMWYTSIHTISEGNRHDRVLRYDLSCIEKNQVFTTAVLAAGAELSIKGHRRPQEGEKDIGSPSPSSSQEARGGVPGRRHGEASFLRVPLLHDHEQCLLDSRGANKAEVAKGSCQEGGVGILSIPYALSEGGWLSLMLLLLLAAACCYTGLLLQRCLNTSSQIESYPDIGELAFGYPGRMAVSFFMYLELYLVATGFLILEGDNLEKLFPNTSLEFGGLKIEGKQLFLVASALIILPTTWLRNLGSLAYVSVGGVLASVILVGCVFWVGAFDHVGFHERGQLINFIGLPTTLGVYAFCYCGHAVFPSLCTSMKDRTQFSKVLLVCFALCTLIYGSMAIFGYLIYGGGLKSQITLNLPVQYVSSKIAIYTTLINPFTKYALMMAPIANTIERHLLSRNKKSTSLFTRTLLVISTVAIALAVPLFGYLIALIGSFLSVIVSLLLPCVCYLKIFGIARRSKLELMAIVGIIVAGILIGVVGTYSSLKQIVLSI